MQLAEILATEFDEQFVQGMRDRMVVSFYKYGPLRKGFPDHVNAISSLTDRLRKYAATGNTEFLIDAANFAMIEFMAPRHPDAHFTPTDSDQSPGRRVMSGLVSHEDNETVKNK